MKKSTIALSVAVVIGAVAAGGSWYTGKQVEQRYGELVQTANDGLKSLKMYGIDAELKDVKVERGFFSSDVTYNLEAKVEDKMVQLKGADKLYHGPFPLNRVMKGNIAPAMASVESNITVPEEFKSVFAKPELLTGKTDISYSENMSGEAKLSAFKWQDQDAFAEVSETSTQFDLTKVGTGKINVKLPLLKIADPTHTLITVEDTEYKIDLKEKSEYPLLSLGDFEMKVKSYSIAGTNPEEDNVQVKFNDLVGKGYSAIKNGVYESAGDFTLKPEILTKDSKQELGQLKMDLFMALDAKATNDLMGFVGSPEKLESEDAKNAALALFSKPVQFHIKDMSLENSKGKNSVSLILNTAELNNLENMQDFSDILNVFKQSKFATNLNIASVEELAKQFLSLNPETKANAAEVAAEQVAQLVIQAQSSGFAEVNAESIKVNLEIDQGKVKLNGNDVPEEDVQSALFMIMLGFASMGMQ